MRRLVNGGGRGGWSRSLNWRGQLVLQQSCLCRSLSNKSNVVPPPPAPPPEPPPPPCSVSPAHPLDQTLQLPPPARNGRLGLLIADTDGCAPMFVEVGA